MRTLDEILASSLAPRRINVRLLEVFGDVAMLLVAIGIYGVASFSAGARGRELAIRAAFGATHRDLARLMLQDELRPIVLGLVAGLTMSLLVAHSLDGMLFGIAAWDPASYVTVTTALLVVAAIASYVPARRAGRADPATLLRA